MSHFNTILHGLLTHIPRHQFESLVIQYQTDRYGKTLSTWQQFVTLLYAHASGKDSLRDIQNGLMVQGMKSYHLGLSKTVCRSTLAEANQRRTWRLYESLFYQLLRRCRSVTPKHKFKFKSPLYTLDATTIEVCLGLFPWARYRTAKGALKLHYQFDHAGHIPCLLTVTDGKHHELSTAKERFPIMPDSIYCVDRAYIDFAWFRRVHEEGSFFVTRLKKNLSYQVLGQHKEIKSQHVSSDELIQRADVYQSAHDQPLPLRLIRYRDPETKKDFEFLTNHLALSAVTIAAIYKARWQIEAFFKWIKQNLKIKSFLGTSQNAVLSQIWVAMCYYLLLTYIKYQTKYSHSLFYLHRLIRATLMDRASLIDLLHLTERRLRHLARGDPQLALDL